MQNHSTLPDISDHSRWRLLLTAGDSGVRATFYDQTGQRAVCYSRRSWQGDPAESLRKIEDAVYDDPVILDDYTTSILVRPTRMTFVPASELGEDADERAEELISLLDAAEGKDVWTEPLNEHITAIWSTPAGVRDFLLRTFPTEDVHLSLLPLVKHVQACGAGEVMWVHLDEHTLDVVAMRDGTPVLINTREYEEAADAAYYIVYAVKALGLGRSTCEVNLSGRSEFRRELLPMLRRHLDFVTNALLPGRVKAAVDEGVSLVEALYFNTGQ